MSNHGRRVRSNHSKRISRERLYDELLKTRRKLPRDLEGRFDDVPVYDSRYPPEKQPWGRVTIVVYPSKPVMNEKTGRYYKSSKHRLFVVCENCNEEIPTGRYHHHYGTMTCVNLAKK